MSTLFREVWTLHRRGIRGPADGQQLQGCHIVSDGTTFHFTEPDIHNVLSSTASSLTPEVPFTFPIFKYQGLEWAITVWKLPKRVGDAIDLDAIGSWSALDGDQPNTAPQNGDFTAQTGGETDTGKAASHAKA